MQHAIETGLPAKKIALSEHKISIKIYLEITMKK